MCHDSGILVVAGGYAVLHMNDARLSVAQLRRAAAEAGRDRLDFLGVQMSGASWHPICYDYPPDVVARVSAGKRVSKFRSVTRLVRSTKPRTGRPVRRAAVLPRPRGRPAQPRHPGARHLPRPGPGDGLAARAGCRTQRSLHLLPGDRVDVGSGDRRARAALGDLAVRRAGRLPGGLRGPPGRRDRRRPGRVSRPGRQRRPRRPGRGALRPARRALAVLPGPDRVRGAASRSTGPRAAGGTCSSAPTGCASTATDGPASPAYRIRVASRLALAGAVRPHRLGGPVPVAALLGRARPRRLQRLPGRPAQARRRGGAGRRRASTRCCGTRTRRSRWPTGDRRFQVSRYCPHAGEDLAGGRRGHRRRAALPGAQLRVRPVQRRLPERPLRPDHRPPGAAGPGDRGRPGNRAGPPESSRPPEGAGRTVHRTGGRPRRRRSARQNQTVRRSVGRRRYVASSATRRGTS